MDERLTPEELLARVQQEVEQSFARLADEVPAISPDVFRAALQLAQRADGQARFASHGDHMRASMIRHNTLNFLVSLKSRHRDDDGGGGEAPDDSDDPARQLVQEAWASLQHGDLEDAESKARHLLETIDTSADWNKGNLIHHGHLILGHVSLAAGHVDEAETQLRAAADTPGSPQLDSFGPNMSLAKALLEIDRDTAVLDFLARCADFWDARFSNVPKWTASIEHGEMPRFGPNLQYGIPHTD